MNPSLSLGCKTPHRPQLECTRLNGRLDRASAQPRQAGAHPVQVTCTAQASHRNENRARIRKASVYSKVCAGRLQVWALTGAAALQRGPRGSRGARGLQTMSTSQRNQKGLNPRGHERGTRPGEPLREPAPPVTPCRRGLQGSKGPTGPQASPEPVTSLAGDNAADGTAASRLPNPALRRPDRAERDPGRQRGRAPGPGRTARPPPALRPVP